MAVAVWGVFRSGQPRLPWRRLVLATLGVALLVAVLGFVGGQVDRLVVFLGFAPSCLLVFLLPEAPVSQPIAVVGGHVLAATVGVAATMVWPLSWWSAALVAGVATGAMALLRVIHPPAVASAVVPLTLGSDWMFVLLPGLVAPLIIVVLALVWHRLSGVAYPVAGIRGGGRPKRR